MTLQKKNFTAICISNLKMKIGLTTKFVKNKILIKERYPTNCYCRLHVRSQMYSMYSGSVTEIMTCYIELLQSIIIARSM